VIHALALRVALALILWVALVTLAYLTGIA
jgi:hypothetical protein